MKTVFVDEGSNAVLYLVEGYSRQDFAIGDVIMIETDKMHDRPIEVVGTVKSIKHHISDKTDDIFEHQMFVSLETI